MSAARRTGTAFETDVVRYLAAHGFPHAERRALRGNADRGDVAGVAGWTLEAKACRALDLAGWAAEAETEARNGATPWSAVVIKRRGKGVAESYVVVSLQTFAQAIAADVSPNVPAVLRLLADQLEAETPPSTTPPRSTT